MRGGGLEPPWLLTASTSSRKADHDSNDLAELERQETSESGPERPILATCSQNGGKPDRIAEALEDARATWSRGRDQRELRKALLAVMGLLDE